MVRYPNGIFTGYSFDEAGRLSEISHERMEADGTRTLLESFTYTYDLNGNITKILKADGSYIDYIYDEWNRLTCENWFSLAAPDVEARYEIDYSFTTTGADKYGDTGNICSKSVRPPCIPWWNASWQYKTRVRVSNDGSETLTGYQVKIVMDTATLITAGKMQADCDDIRVVNTDQNAELDFWINPETINTTTTEIWAKVAIPSSGTTLYVYYGNSSATSASSGADTFEFFDDFESYTTGALSGQGGWENTKGSTIVVEEDGRKMIQVIAGNLPRHSCNFGDNYERAVNVRAKVKVASEQLTIALFDGNTASSPGYNDYLNGYVYIFYGWGNTKHRLTRGAGSSNVWLCDMITATPAQLNNYYELEARWLDADKTDGDNLFGLVDGEIPAGLEARDGEYTSRTYLGFASWSNAEWRVDRVYVRKCLAVEPAVTIGGSYQKPAYPSSTPTPQTTTFQYDDYNKLTEITHPDSTTEALSYDDNGQLVKSEKSTGETTDYEWNDQGMLVKVILPNGEPVEYFYDGNQRLISRKSSDGVDNFVQSGWDIVTKMDDVGKRTYYTGMSSVSGAGSSVSGSSASGSSASESASASDSARYFHYNHRGDTVLVTDSEGNILNNFSYEAYGKPTNSEGIPFNNLSIKDLPNLFVCASGIKYDTKTDLHYMGVRYGMDFKAR